MGQRTGRRVGTKKMVLAAAFKTRRRRLWEARPGRRGTVVWRRMCTSGTSKVRGARDESEVVMRRLTRPMEAGTSWPMANRVVAGRRVEVVNWGWRRSKASPTMSPGVPMSAMAVVIPASGAEKMAEPRRRGRCQTAL